MKDQGLLSVIAIILLLIGCGSVLMLIHWDKRDQRELEFSRMCNEKHGIAKRIDGMLQCTVSRNTLGVAV